MPFEDNNEYYKGRGAQINTYNRFLKNRYITEHLEGLDEELYENTSTQIIEEHAKSIVSVSNSPDLSFIYSINPYQGCEHGCIYCYARNSHEYYGFSAGLDFERKIVVKRNAAALLETFFKKPKYIPQPIMLSGNTDCYQPTERKLKITRSLLEVFLKYRHPLSIISKNNLIARDIDLLKELSALNLVHVTVTINSLNESLRQKMEPRTVTGRSRLMLINKLASENIPVRLMMAPIIPGLNSEEIPALVSAAANEGAKDAIFTIVRLNGAIAEIFDDWIRKAYPDRADKVLNMIASCHGGSLNDSIWGTRMKGDGKIAESIHQLFKVASRRFLPEKGLPPLETDHFCLPGGKQLGLF